MEKIDPPTQEDLARDAAADMAAYGSGCKGVFVQCFPDDRDAIRVSLTGLPAWIRRAVAAEAKMAELQAMVTDLLREVNEPWRGPR